MKDEAFKECEQIIKQHSSSFYYAFKHLDKKGAKAVYAIYAFCRTADDIVDIEVSDVALNSLQRELEEFENGNIPGRPFWKALREVFSEYKMDIKPFHEMLQGQRMDLSFRPLDTEEELIKYCYLVAGTVGLMLLPILADTRNSRVAEISINLGLAMQLTNILRDIGEDYDNSRIYLPMNLMDSFGYSVQDLKLKTINTSFINLWEHLASKAEKYYANCIENIELYNKKGRFPIMLSANYYKAILAKVRENGYDVFNKRAYVSPSEKKSIFLQSKITSAF